jgi:hypothetical protein
MLDVMAAQPGVFSGVAVVDETKPDVVSEMKALALRGVRGFRVRASRELADAWKTSQGMRKMWTHAAETGLAICPLADPDALPAIQAMCKEFPKTRVVVDHFARIGVSGSVLPEELEQLSRLSDFENTFVKTSAFYALGAYFAVEIAKLAGFGGALIASPAYSITWPVPPAVPISPIIARIISFAVTPFGNLPSTVMRIFLALDWISVCVASTCSTSDVPIPCASAPNAPCVEVWLSPHTIVVPGSVKPCSGPIMWTTPCLLSSSLKYSIPNSRAFSAKAATCVAA